MDHTLILYISVLLLCIGSILNTLKVRRLEEDLTVLKYRFKCSREALWHSIDEVERLSLRRD